MNNALFMLLAAGAGGCIALQASANSKFRQTLDSEPWATPIWASYLSICGTILSASLALLILRPPAPTWDSMRSTQWWNWIGGPLGALIVLAGATLVRELGAAAFIALVVGGQLACSLLLDHFALMGLEERPMSFGKVFGALLVIGGVLCLKFL
jgi:transporter family-2 protein